MGVDSDSDSAVLRKRGPSLDDALAMVAAVASLFSAERSLRFPVWFRGSSPKTLDSLWRMFRSLGPGVVLLLAVSCAPVVSGRRAGNIAAVSSLEGKLAWRYLHAIWAGVQG